MGCLNYKTEVEVIIIPVIFRAGVKFNKTYLKLESSNKYQSKRYSEIRIAYKDVYDGCSSSG